MALGEGGGGAFSMICDKYGKSDKNQNNPCPKARFPLKSKQTNIP